MKNTLFLVSILSGFTFASAQTGNIGINTSTPHKSSVLDITSDTRGLLLPRLMTAAVNDLSSTAAEGLIVYDKEQKKFLGWDGSKWQNLGYEEQNTAPYASNVTISGSYTTGQTLTGNYTYTDADGNGESGSTFLWNHANNSSGLNAAAISGATAQTYTQQTTDVGKYLQFCVTPKSATGASPGVQKCSVWSGPTAAVVANAAPTVSSISLSGALNVGGTVTGTYAYNDTESDAQNTTATGSTYQWKIAGDSAGANTTNATGTNNSGATNGTDKVYVLQASEAGKYIQYCVKPIANTGTTSGIETCSSWSGPVASYTSGTVFNESFESGAANGYFTVVTTNANIAGVVSGSSPSAHKPASSPYSATGTQGYKFSANSNTTGTAVFTSPTIDATQYTNNMTFSMRIAGFGTATGNGLEVLTSPDYVLVEISTDGGNNYSSSSITQGGNSNANWPFSTTGVSSLAFGSTAVSMNQPTAGANTTNAISTIRITNIPNTSTQLKFRITVLNEQTSTVSEYWVIDDIKLVAP